MITFSFFSWIQATTEFFSSHYQKVNITPLWQINPKKLFFVCLLQKLFIFWSRIYNLPSGKLNWIIYPKKICWWKIHVCVSVWPLVILCLSQKSLSVLLSDRFWRGGWPCCHLSAACASPLLPLLSFSPHEKEGQLLTAKLVASVTCRSSNDL